MHDHHEKYGKEGSKKDAKKYHYSQDSGKAKQGSDGVRQKASHLSETETDSGKETHRQPKYSSQSEEDQGGSISKNYPDLEEAKESGDDRALERNSDEQLGEEDPGNPHRKIKSEKEMYKKAEYMAQEGPIAYYMKGEKSDYPREQDAVKKEYKNVQYMDEDGPTSVYVGRSRNNPARLEGRGHEDRNSQANNQGFLPEEGENGHRTFTEEQLLEDKEGEDALQVFGPLHQDDDHKHEESQQGYHVAQLHTDLEPARQESQTHISKVHIQSTYHPVQIVAMYKLPPIE